MRTRPIAMKEEHGDPTTARPDPDERDTRPMPDPGRWPMRPRRSGEQDRGMTTKPDQQRRATLDERRFLEALVFWRGLYAERGPRDRVSVGTLASVIGEAERRMRAIRLGALA